MATIGTWQVRARPGCLRATQEITDGTTVRILDLPEAGVLAILLDPVSEPADEGRMVAWSAHLLGPDRVGVYGGVTHLAWRRSGASWCAEDGEAQGFGIRLGLTPTWAQVGEHTLVVAADGQECGRLTFRVVADLPPGY